MDIKQTIAHSVHLGHNLGSALVEAGKKHIAKVRVHLDNAKQYVGNLESQTGYSMPEFHESIDKAKRALNMSPPDWETVKAEIKKVLDNFRKKL